MKCLLEYNWPGNVRELDNLISVACALKEGSQLSIENIPPNYGIVKIAKESAANLNANLADVNSSLVGAVDIDDRNQFDPNKTWKE